MRLARLNRSELTDLIDRLVISNTPATLYRSLKRSPTILRLREEVSSEHLSRYFTILTSRRRQSALTVALAYGVLVALLTKDSAAPIVGISRLTWSEQFAEYAKGDASISTMVLTASPAPRLLSHLQSTELPRGLWTGSGTPFLHDD